jgi:hypothetical protein
MSLANRLRAAGLSRTIVRPGRVANGGWYAWSAVGRQRDSIGCFRRLVSSLRSATPGLRSSWTVDNGWNLIAVATTCPGDTLVDLVASPSRAVAGR